ncbi:S-type anion channel SLAH1-like [Typha angustifolia]|uniref:S-type anion channel SLAH1-like n=1 Tax=Typha angustifolia TaxID=59011 RepID=UPI003C2D8FFE
MHHPPPMEDAKVRHLLITIPHSPVEAAVDYSDDRKSVCSSTQAMADHLDNRKRLSLDFEEMLTDYPSAQVTIDYQDTRKGSSLELEEMMIDSISTQATTDYKDIRKGLSLDSGKVMIDGSFEQATTNHQGTRKGRKGSSSTSSSGLGGMLTRFHAGYFRISLSLCGQALLWKTLSEPTTDPHALRPLLRLLPSAAFVLLWSLALLSLAALSLLFAARCLLAPRSIRAELAHHVGMNYLFAPWISWLLLLQSTPFLRPNSDCYHLLWWLFSLPILILDVKIYGQWFTKGKKFLSMVANPTSQITVIGNLVGARAAAQMGRRECAVCMFSLGIAHYLVLFVTLYQRFLGSDSLPVMLRPVFFLFFAAPSMASLAWDSINHSFDTSCKMLFFLSLFLFASLVSRPILFKKSMRRFNVAWWAYSFPLTFLALTATEYAQEVKGEMANLLMLVLSVLSVVVTLVLLVFTAIKTNEILPHDDPFACSRIMK